MLGIEVALLTGRYIATAYNARDESEWPPHPARLFSALAATHFAAHDVESQQAAQEHAVLEWLEELGPPSIQASDEWPRDVVTVFVPVNDVALTDVDSEASRVEDARNALARAEAGGDAKAIKAARAGLRKVDDAFKSAIERETRVPTRRLDPRLGERVLPESRGRQPRTFPSVTPADPFVTYVWPDAEPNAEQRRVLDGLLQRVVRLGHSSSLVSMRLTEATASPRWRPNVNGEKTLRVIEKGQLEALQRAFDRHRETEPRVMPFVPAAYTQSVPIPIESPAVSVFSDEWLVLRRVGGPSLPMTAAAGVARAARRTLMSYSDQPIPELLSGHGPDGSASLGPHLAIVPLPFVGHEHASGSLFGLALILPRATSAEDRQAVYRSVARWEDKYRVEDEDTPPVQLNLGAAGELRLERIEWGPAQATLRPAVWCRPSTTWYSVTPVALDRNPGDLRSRDPEKLAVATREAVETVCVACERIGLPRPVSVEILPAARWSGAAKARHYPPYPGEIGRAQRVLTHVRVVFDRRVRGPLLLGAGRFVGLGLLRPGVEQ